MKGTSHCFLSTGDQLGTTKKGSKQRTCRSYCTRDNEIDSIYKQNALPLSENLSLLLGCQGINFVLKREAENIRSCCSNDN
ncbi:hypothetical protein Peur_005328 [Populus x canadensis]